MLIKVRVELVKQIDLFNVFHFTGHFKTIPNSQCFIHSLAGRQSINLIKKFENCFPNTNKESIRAANRG